MSPADQPQAIDCRRSADPPTLWLSLGLGSVLLHLVFFIVVSVVLTRTAKVQLEVEPIAVEFVDPQADIVQARSAATSRAIAARPGVPSSSNPPSTQAQPSALGSQPFALNQPVEQPFTLPSPVKQRRVPPRPQPQQPNPFNTPVSQQPSPISEPSQPQSTPFPQQSNLPIPSPTQPIPNTNSTPGGLTDSVSSPTPQPVGTQSPVESGTQIGQLPQGRSATVNVQDFRQTADFQKQPPKPIDRQKTVSIDYPSELSNRAISLETNVYIAPNGSVIDTKETKLLSGSTIDQETLDRIANDIFKQWKFVPAQDVRDGKVVTPPISTLRIQAKVTLR